MHKKEMIERGFTADKNGKIIDDMGNEYRDEQGLICFLKEGCKHEDQAEIHRFKWLRKYFLVNECTKCEKLSVVQTM